MFRQKLQLKIRVRPRKEEFRKLNPFKYPISAIQEAGKVNEDRHNNTPIKNNPMKFDLVFSGTLRSFAIFFAFSVQFIRTW